MNYVYNFLSGEGIIMRKNSIDKILVSYEKTKGNSELIKLLTPFGITSKTAMERNRK